MRQALAASLVGLGLLAAACSGGNTANRNVPLINPGTPPPPPTLPPRFASPRAATPTAPVSPPRTASPAASPAR